jgi:hypothetical protein
VHAAISAADKAAAFSKETVLELNICIDRSLTTTRIFSPILISK